MCTLGFAPQGTNSEIMQLGAYFDSWHFGPSAFLEMEIEMFALECKQILSLEKKERAPVFLKYPGVYT